MKPPIERLIYDGPRSVTDLVVIHYTAGYTAESAYRAMNARKLSAHVVIDRDGTVYCNPEELDLAGRHAGPALWDGRGGVNGRSVGIELVNFGFGAGQYTIGPDRRPLTASGGPVKVRYWLPDAESIPTGASLIGRVEIGARGDQVLVLMPCEKPWRARGHYWEPYPEAQVVALQDVLSDLVERYRLDWHRVIGHDWALPTKSDPGPAFPWVRVLQEVADLANGSVPFDERAAISTVQSHLRRLGSDPGKIDGLWGGKTARALEQALPGRVLPALKPQDAEWFGIALRLIERGAL